MNDMIEEQQRSVSSPSSAGGGVTTVGETQEEELSRLGPELLRACRSENEELALNLLEQGDIPKTYTDPKAPHWQALHWACLHGMVSVVEQLVDTGIESKNSPLFWASMKGHLRVVWLLLEAGYSCEAIDECGNTPLHLAATAGHSAVAQTLAKQNAHLIYVKNLYNNTPLDLARHNHLKEQLLDISKRDNTNHNLELYKKASQDILEASQIAQEGAIEFRSTCTHLKGCLETGEKLQVDTYILHKGYSALKRAEVHAELILQMRKVHEASPIQSQATYTLLVHKLLQIIHQATELRNVFKQQLDNELYDDELDEEANTKKIEAALYIDLGAPERILQHARDLVERSLSEFWLSHFLKASDTTKLEKALNKAEESHANADLLAKAKAILEKARAEKKLQLALNDMPVVRLPIAQPPPDYWQPEDIGHLATQAAPVVQEGPLPKADEAEEPKPESAVVPLQEQWIPAQAFSDLSAALDFLHNSLTAATHAGADSLLLSKAQDLHHSASDQLKQLERKDAEDRELALAAAEKAAAKKAKSKKSKNSASAKKKEPASSSSATAKKK